MAHASAVSERLQTFMAFDFGTRRTGVAVGNRMLKLAQPQGTIRADSADARWEQVARHIRDWQPDALVVGVPFHPDGRAHENTALARRFARQLQGRFGLPVFEVDERYSTTEAQSQGGDPASIDAASAAVILDQFLRGLS